MRYRRNEFGFTLIELLVGVLIASAIAYSAFSLYLTMHKEMLVQEIVSDTQDNARAATEGLSRLISMAGFNIPATLLPIETHDSNPDTIAVNYNSGHLQTAHLSSAMTSLTANLVCSGSDLTGLIAGDWAYICDPSQANGEFFPVSVVNYGTSTISHTTAPLTRLYPSGSSIMKISRVRFYVDRADTLVSKLMFQEVGSQPQIFAENIVDLNFRYFMSDGSIVTQTNTPNNIRMVEIDVVGRSYRTDLLLNHCTRNFSLRVKVRNLEYPS